MFLWIHSYLTIRWYTTPLMKHEEMKYLMMFAPMLFLMYQMLKDGDDKVVEVEPEEENSEQSAEQNTDKNNSSIAQAVITYSPDTAAS